MVTTTGLVILAYLLGSVPCGYLLVKAVCGVDVRQYGSHNIGAINVLRVGGLKLGFLTLLCDAGKAWGVVSLAAVLNCTPWQMVAVAFSVLVGHAYSVWFVLRERRFAEGKSVAGTLGVLVALAQTHRLPWLVPAIPVSIWLLGLVGPRLVTGRWLYLSLATMAATISIPFVVWLAGAAPPWKALAVAIAALVLTRHRHNLERLRSATEPTVVETLRAAHRLPPHH